MKHLYLVRHGESIQNIGLSDALHIPDHAAYLTERGMYQAHAAGEFLATTLKHILPGAIFSVNGERMVFQGSHGKSKIGKPNYYEFVGKGNFVPRKCRLISTGGGWQFI